MRLLPVYGGIAFASQTLIFLFSLDLSFRAGGGAGALVALHLLALLTFSLAAFGLLRHRAAPEVAEPKAQNFAHTIEERFSDWELTPAEKDVAWFTVKGLSIGEIAAVRGTSEGTVKAQGNAIYRKAGVAGRVQLLAAFMDELILSTDDTAENQDQTDAA